MTLEIAFIDGILLLWIIKLASFKKVFKTIQVLFSTHNLNMLYITDEQYAYTI